MAIKHNDNIHTKGIELIPEVHITGKTTWMFRFTRIDDSRQSSDQVYYGIGWKLHHAGHVLLATDYHHVADLIREESNPQYRRKFDIQRLVGELRRNLNRGQEYLESEKRNATLHVMAKTLERSIV